MKLRVSMITSMALALCASLGCELHGKPKPGPEVPNPDTVLDSQVLYNENCAGCHGADGRKGAAPAIGDSVYLAIVPEDALRAVISKGRPGTVMAAFAQKEGGMLTDAQVDAIVHGLRQRWGSSTAATANSLPPYAANAAGDPQRGQAVYSKFCASCHGEGTSGGPKAGTVLNPAYLSLVSDQGLRTIVITGRPDFNAPDFRNNIPGQPMTDQEITDVVAYLAAHRPAVAKMQTMTQPAAGTSGGSQ